MLCTNMISAGSRHDRDEAEVNFTAWQWALAMALDFLVRTLLIYFLRAFLLDIPTPSSSVIPAFLWTMLTFICLGFAQWYVRARNSILRCVLTLAVANILPIAILAAISSQGRSGIVSLDRDPLVYDVEMAMLFSASVAVNLLPIAATALAGRAARRLSKRA